MRVRIDGEHLNVDRQAQLIRDDEIARARWDVERAIVLELNEHGKLRRGFARKVQTDRRLHWLRLPDWLEMGVQYQIILWIEAPRHPGRLLPWRSARFPKEEMAIGIEGLAFERQIHAREAFAPGCLTETRRAGPIDQQVRMMHGVCVARTDLYGLHIARL